MNPQLTKIMPVLQNFKADLQQLYGDQMDGLILYGSYARGDAKEESDIDVLVLLKQMQSPYTEIRKMGDINNDYLLRYEYVISPVPTTTERYKTVSIPLYRNIEKEGIVL